MNSSVWRERLWPIVQGQSGSKCRIRKQPAMLFAQQTYCHRRGHDCLYAGEAYKIWHKSVDGRGLEEWLRNKLRCLPWK